MPCPCPGSQKACCPQNNTFDSLTVVNGLRVLRGPTTLCGETEVEKLCFKDTGKDGSRWCVQETGDNKLTVTYQGVPATKVTFDTDGTISTSGNLLVKGAKVEPEGVIAESTETLKASASVGGLNPSVSVTTTFIEITGNNLNVTGTLAAGLYDGQIKRVVPTFLGTGATNYVLTVSDFLDPTNVTGGKNFASVQILFSNNPPQSPLIGFASSAVILQWSATAPKIFNPGFGAWVLVSSL